MKIGDKIYVPDAFYLSRGNDDVLGGIATVIKINREKYFTSVQVKEHPGHEYNIEYLESNQKEWETEYKGKIARPDPDDRPEFNRWD